MKKNYAAWNPDFDEYHKQLSLENRLRFLVRFAVLAPSTHNSQPWKFKIEDNQIFLKPDFARRLPVSDPLNRHLYISLGCALENLLTAADFYGLRSEVSYLPADHKDTAALIYFTTGTDNKDPGHLIFSIPKRRNNRHKYADRMPDQNFLDKILALSDSEIEVSVITNTKLKNQIADLLMVSRLKAFSNRSFRSEMADYKRTNFTSSYFGMPGFTMGIGNLVSLIAGFMIRNFNVMKILHKSEESLLKNYTPVFAFVNAKNDSEVGWLKTGQIFQRIMLMAEQSGIQTGISAVPLNIQQIQVLLDAVNRPQISLRLGYASVIPPHSPRLPAEETIEA